jgi:hypothetical protein
MTRRLRAISLNAISRQIQLSNTVVSAVQNSGSATLTGTLLTADQPNITGLGTLLGLDSSGVVTITNATESVSSSTGALRVLGGAGISGNVNIGRNLGVTGNIRASGIQSTPIGSQTPSTGVFTSLTADTLNVAGGGLNGVAIGQSTPAAGKFTTIVTTQTIDSAGNIIANANTTSTSTTTGALQVRGGAGIRGNVYVGENVVITGGLTAATLNVAGGGLNGVAIGASTPDTGRFTTLESTSLATLGSLYTANATVTGGTITGIQSFEADHVDVTTIHTLNFGTANAVITGGSINVPIIATNNFSTANAQITGGTLQNINLVSANTRVSGGFADNFPIGANTAAPGRFTTVTSTGIITSSGNLVANSQTASTSTTTGALVVAGGAGISGNVHVGNLTTSGTLIVNDLIVNGAAALSEIASGNASVTVTPGTITFTVGGTVIAEITEAGLTLTAPLAMGGNPIGGLATPASSDQAATKGYADGSASASAFPVGDYGDIGGSAAQDAFGQSLSPLSYYDLKNTPNGSVLVRDLLTSGTEPLAPI